MLVGEVNVWAVLPKGPPASPTASHTGELGLELREWGRSSLRAGAFPLFLGMTAKLIARMITLTIFRLSRKIKIIIKKGDR